MAESLNNVLHKKIGTKPSFDKCEAERYYNKQYLVPKITRVNQQSFNQTRAHTDNATGFRAMPLAALYSYCFSCELLIFASTIHFIIKF